MDLYSAAATYEKKPSAYDPLEETPHISNYELHILNDTNDCASAVIQAFARFMYHEKTGEPNAPYNTLHKTLSTFELQIFLRAFGYAKEDLPEDVEVLWGMIKVLFQPREEQSSAEELKDEISTLRAQLEGFKTVSKKK